MTRQRFAVVYDNGAAAPRDIVLGLAELGEVVFLVPRSEHNARLWPVLKQLSPVVTLSDDVTKVRELAPTAILTFSEDMLRRTATIAARLGLPFHSEETVRVLTDKVLQRRQLREAGVDDLRTRELRSAADWPAAAAHVGLPAVIKPVVGGGSRNTHLATDLATGQSILDGLYATDPASQVQVEEFLTARPCGRFGDYVAVESLVCGDDITHVAVTGKVPLRKPFRESGRFWPNALSAVEEQAIRNLATRALRALGVNHGVVHTEVKLTPQGPRIIEVNGRLGGFVHELAQIAGAPNLITAAGQLALGRQSGYMQPDLDQVHFSHNNLTPTRTCTLMGVHGVEQARKVPGIDGHRMLRQIGEVLDQGVMTDELDMVWGAAADHDGMWTTLDSALAELSFDFRFPSGLTRLTAHDLIATDG